MILKICDESLFFSLGHTKYLDIFCYATIFISFCLFFILKSRLFTHNKLSEIIKKVVVLITSLIFLVFVALTFVISLLEDSYMGCSCKFKKMVTVVEKQGLSNDIQGFASNKVIVVGDSRIEYILDERNKYSLPVNFRYIAKSGAGYSWFESVALSKLEQILKMSSTDETYHVVFNMGVNDLQYTGDYIKVSDDYYEEVKKLAIRYPRFKFYYLSVNPIDDVKIFNHDPNNIRSNEKIEKFNQNINEKRKESGLRNFNYCDSYNEVEFKTPDGLHYNVETNQKIINYISNNCVQYK